MPTPTQDDRPCRRLSDIVISHLPWRCLIANILIRDLSQEAVDRIDAAAANLGLSRNEYLRRKFEEGTNPITQRTVSAEDWQRSAEVFGDLADPTVMDAAWR